MKEGRKEQRRKMFVPKPGHISLLLLWILLLRDASCHDHGDEERVQPDKVYAMSFTYADVSRYVVYT